MAERSHYLCFVVIFLVPLALFFPNILSGGVMLPLDLFHHLQPFSGSIPPELEKVHNSSLSDLITLYYPSMELLRSGKDLIPLWNPFSFFGVPALANAQNGMLFPLSWFFKFLSPGPAYLMLALCKMWFCGFFAFLFFRKLGFHSLASLLGSIGFMLCGHMIVWFGYPTSLPLSVWPFLMWALEVFLEKASLRNLAFLGLAFGLLFIGGQPQTAFLISAAAALYLAVRGAPAGKGVIRIWAGFGIAAFLGLCLSAPQILPFFEYLRLSSASLIRGDMGHYGWKHYQWFTLISWIMPRFFGDVRNESFWGFSSLLGEAVYIGAIPLVFAVIGLISSWKKNFYKAALAIFIMGCLGLYIKPLARLYLSLPLLSDIDNNKLMAMVAFGLIAFSVMGFEHLLMETNDVRKMLVRFIWVALAWVLFVGFGCYYFRKAFTELGVTRSQLHEGIWLVALLIAGCAVLWLLKAGRLSRRSAACLIIAVTLVDVFRIWINYIPSYPDKYLIPESAALTYLKNHAGHSRVMGWGDMLPPEISVLYRLQDMRGYDGMTPYSYYRILDKIDPSLHDLYHKMRAARPPKGKWTRSTLFFDSYAPIFDSTDPKVINDLSRIDYYSSGISKIERPSILSICGVRYILSQRGAVIPGGAGFKLAHQADADVWENPKALPRAFVVTRPIIVKDDNAALEAISDRNFPFEKTAVVTLNGRSSVDNPATESGESVLVPADIQYFDAERIQIQATAPQAGWLILSDLYYPGWEATCDANPTRIYAGNYIFRAVRISAGTHIVEFRYKPMSFRVGCLLALSACIAVVVLMFIGTFRGRRAKVMG